ncbi:MAG: VOC family protein [Rhizomicrobium sp.]
MRLTFLPLCAMLLAISPAARAAASAEAPMTPAPIVFFDIAGPDAAKLKDFYAGNFGWTIDAANAIKTPGLDGTLRQDPPEKIIYIGVPDIDAAMAKIRASGGEIVTPKIPIPTGVFVLFKDPAGNRMGLVQAKP